MVQLDDYKIFVKRMGLMGITNILVVITSIIITPILTKTLSINDYGLWVQVNITYLLITGFNALGLPYTMVRYLSAEKDKDKIQEAFYSLSTLILVVSLITSLIMIYFSKKISILLFAGDASLVILTSLIIFVGSLNLIFIEYFRAFGRMKIYSFLLLVQAYFSLVLVSYFTLTNKGILTIVSGLLITQLIISIITIPIIIHSIGFKLPKFKNIIEYLNFGLPTIPSNLSYWMVDSSDRYLIAFILGVVYCRILFSGLYFRNGDFYFFPFSLILPAVLPKYYDNGNMEQVHLIINYSMKYFILVAIPSVFVLSLLSKQLLLLLTTPEIMLHGYLVTPFVALSAFIGSVYGIFSNYLTLKKKTKIVGGIWITASIVTISNFLFIPYFGIIGAAMVTLLSYSVAFMLGLYYTNQYFKIKFNYRFIIKSIIASLIMSIFIILINPKELLGLIIVIVMSILIYLSFIFAFKGINRTEIDFFVKLIK